MSVQEVPTVPCPDPAMGELCEVTIYQSWDDAEVFGSTADMCADEVSGEVTCWTPYTEATTQVDVPTEGPSTLAVTGADDVSSPAVIFGIAALVVGVAFRRYAARR